MKNENKQMPLPYKTITDYFGTEFLKFHRKRDYASFRTILAREEGADRESGNFDRGTEQERNGNVHQYNGNDQADSVDGSAFSMENEEQTGIGTGSIFEEPSAQYEPESLAETLGRQIGKGQRPLTEDQKRIIEIGKKLGLEVDFDYRGRANGKITGNRVSINPNCSDPLRFVFKHEVVHWFENSKLYDSFQKYLFDESAAFQDWLKKKGYSSLGAAITATKKRYGDIGYEELKKEVVADFVGDTLFGKRDGKITDDFLHELTKKDRNLAERFIDWIKSLVQRMKGTAVEKDIIKLEQKMIRMKETVDTKAVVQGKEKYSINHIEFSKDDIQNNIEELANMDSVHHIDAQKLEKTGKRPSEIFSEFFNSIGNNVYSETYGDIAMQNSSVKSEIRHGITAEKIASIEAIPDVIKSGKVIFYAKKGDGFVDRMVICAPITIGQESYYMGVMIQRDSQNQRLYLHNVLIENETSISSLSDLVTTGAFEENGNLTMTNILQKALFVKNNISENSGTDY